jgi:hypothetical protein
MRRLQSSCARWLRSATRTKPQPLLDIFELTEP